MSALWAFLLSVAACTPSPWLSPGLISLSEGWQVVHDQLLSPQAFPPDAPSVPIPEFTLPGPDGSYYHPAVSTYRLVLDLPQEHSGSLWGLVVPEIFCSYALYVDGRRIAEMGVPSLSPAVYVPRVQPLVHTFFARPRTEILLQVANYHVAGDKIRSAVLAGPEPDLRRWLLVSLALEVFFIAVLAISGLVLIVLPEMNNTLASRLTGAFLLTLALRVSVTGNRLILFALPWLDFEWVSDLGYATASLAPLTFVWALAARFREQVDKTSVGFLSLLHALALITIFWLPTPQFPPHALAFDLSLLLSIGWVLTLPLGLKLKGQRLEFWFWLGLAALPLAALADFLAYSGLTRSFSWMPLGLLAYILCQLIHQALVVSRQERALHAANRVGEESLHKKKEFLEQLQHHILTPLHNLGSLLETLELPPERDRTRACLQEELNALARKLRELVRRNEGEGGPKGPATDARSPLPPEKGSGTR